MDCSLVIGREGLTPTVLADLNRQLDTRELVKVKLLAERDERAALCAEIVTRTGASEAGAVGKTALFYRQQLDPERRVIDLALAKPGR
jgi:RNA-binding protein